MANRDASRRKAAFLPSPSASSMASTSTVTGPLLPQTRAHPLVPGSQKEVAFIEHIDAKILQITRRYAKKFSKEKGSNDEAPGYDNFAQCVEDLETVFNIVWISGTPALQTPYLLSLTGLFSSYLPAFPFAPMPTFRIARRLDTAFAYLLEPPSAPQNELPLRSHIVSPTDKVRIKSLISATRVAAVETAEKSGHSHSVVGTSDEEESEEEDDEPAVGEEEENGGISHDQVSRGLSKIFQQTLELLGDDLVAVS